MLYSTTISIQDNKFKGIVINNKTSNIIHETELYNSRVEATKAINNYIIDNNETINSINSNTVLQTEEQPLNDTVTITHRRCCGG
jgi:hypothetical protein